MDKDKLNKWIDKHITINGEPMTDTQKKLLLGATLVSIIAGAGLYGYWMMKKKGFSIKVGKPPKK